MKSTIERLVKKYNPSTVEETKSIIREVLQSIVLIGLSRSDFFLKASFYGGTALRLFYGLNRYSEDLDFTLNYVDENFKIEPYINKIKEVALSYGLDLEIVTKTKKSHTAIESAFAKLNTYQTFLTLKISEELSNLLHKDEIIKIKFEVDTNPSLGFNKEVKMIEFPEFATVSVLDESSLFSGKLHAVLSRNYKNTVKGRDYYDFLFYIRKGVKPNLNYLKNKLVETGKINKNDDFNVDILKCLLKERFLITDFNQVKNDAMRFVYKNEDLSYYSKDFFIQMLDRLDE